MGAPSSQGRGRGRAARSYVDRLLGCRPLPENYSELWQMEKLELFEEDLFLEQHSDPESSDDGLLVNLFEGDLSKKTGHSSSFREFIPWCSELCTYCRLCRTRHSRKG